MDDSRLAQALTQKLLKTRTTETTQWFQRDFENPDDQEEWVGDWDPDDDPFRAWEPAGPILADQADQPLFDFQFGVQQEDEVEVEQDQEFELAAAQPEAQPTSSLHEALSPPALSPLQSPCQSPTPSPFHSPAHSRVSSPVLGPFSAASSSLAESPPVSSPLQLSSPLSSPCHSPCPSPTHSPPPSRAEPPHSDTLHSDIHSPVRSPCHSPVPSPLHSPLTSPSHQQEPIHLTPSDFNAAPEHSPEQTPEQSPVQSPESSLIHSPVRSPCHSPVPSPVVSPLTSPTLSPISTPSLEYIFEQLVLNTEPQPAAQSRDQEDASSSSSSSTSTTTTNGRNAQVVDPLYDQSQQNLLQALEALLHSTQPPGVDQEQDQIGDAEANLDRTTRSIAEDGDSIQRLLNRSQELSRRNLDLLRQPLSVPPPASTDPAAQPRSGRRLERVQVISVEPRSALSSSLSSSPPVHSPPRSSSPSLPYPSSPSPPPPPPPPPPFPSSVNTFSPLFQGSVARGASPPIPPSASPRTASNPPLLSLSPVTATATLPTSASSFLSLSAPLPLTQPQPQLQPQAHTQALAQPSTQPRQPHSTPVIPVKPEAPSATPIQIIPPSSSSIPAEPSQDPANRSVSAPRTSEQSFDASSMMSGEGSGDSLVMILRRENAKLLVLREQADQRVKDLNATVALLRAQCEGQAPYIGELIDRNSQLTCHLQESEQNSLRLESLVQKQSAVVQELTYNIACERAGRETNVSEQEGSSRSALIRQRTQQDEEIYKRDRKIKELKNEVFKLKELLDQHQRLDNVHLSQIQNSQSFLFSPAAASSQTRTAMLSTPFGGGKGPQPQQQQQQQPSPEPALESPVLPSARGFEGHVSEDDEADSEQEQEQASEKDPTETIEYWKERCAALEQEQTLHRTAAEEALAGVSGQLQNLLLQQQDTSSSSSSTEPPNRIARASPSPSLLQLDERECERLERQLAELQQINTQLLARLEEATRRAAALPSDDQALAARLNLAVQRLEEAKLREAELEAENRELRARLQFLFQHYPQLFSMPVDLSEAKNLQGQGEGQLVVAPAATIATEDGEKEQEELTPEAATAKKIQQMEEGFLTKYVAAFAIICEKERIIAELTARLQEEIAINEDAARRIMDVSAELATYSSKNFL